MSALLAASSAVLWAQDTGREGEVGELVRAVTRPGGPVFVYHTADLPMGYGFILYRDGQRLTAEPVYKVSFGEDLQGFAGESFERLRRSLAEETPTGVLLRLQSSRVAAGLATFLYPDVARALGRLYVDSTAAVGRQATYRFEFVSDAGLPTGKSLEGQVRLVAQSFPAPSGLTAGHTGRTVRLAWHYLAQEDVEIGDDDGVIQFFAYRRIAGGAERLDDVPVIRNAAVDTFSVEFPARSMEAEEEYWVTAVDVTGLESRPSPSVRYTVVDREAPEQMRPPQTRMIRDGAVEVRWLPSEAQDLAGYHVYRAFSGEEEARYTRLTREPESPGRLSFIDREAPGQGGRSYYYAVAAIDSSGNEGVRSIPAMTLVYDETPPPAPSNLQAEYLPEDDRVRLRWQGGTLPADFLTYLVLRRRLSALDPDADAQLNQEDLRIAEWTDGGPDGQGFEEGQRYRWTVFASDSTRNFSDSVLVDFEIPNLRPPAVPRELTAQNAAGKAVALRWVGSPDLDVAGYAVYRAVDGDAEVAYGQSISHLPSFVDEEVEPARTYRYRVTALDVADNESDPSAPAEIQFRDQDPPRSVRNVRVAALDAGGTRVSWEPVFASDLAGYRVYRSGSVTGTFGLVHEVAAGTTEWVDPAGTVTHWYRLVAVDTSENESIVSEPARAASPMP